MKKSNALKVVTPAQIDAVSHFSKLENLLNLEVEQAVALVNVLVGGLDGNNIIETDQHDALLRTLEEKLFKIRSGLREALGRPDCEK
jgi:hypothetical protein